LGGNLINGDVTIGDKCLIGAGAIIRPGKQIANYSVVGIGSVVIRNVNEGATVFGNPAQKIS
jgi:acetyltransferase-like isoleucine patch superfamily enzyme